MLSTKYVRGALALALAASALPACAKGTAKAPAASKQNPRQNTSQQAAALRAQVAEIQKQQLEAMRRQVDRAWRLAQAAEAPKEQKEKKAVPAALNFTLKSLDGKDVSLSQYAGKAVMIVNTASKCGNTPQYEGLEALYKKYQAQGFVILGFPSGDFNNQELGSDEEIATFCEKNYGVTFPMFSKVSVKGESKTPLYKFLTSEETNPGYAGEIDWNFAKFLVGRDGKVAARFKARVQPGSPEVVEAIEKALAAPAA